ncbi:MAG: GNAT family N-acetyltransferase [Bacteroidia bacterium]
MDINYRSLKDTTLNDLTETFNSSFENYFVPLKLSEEQLRSKLKMDNTKLELSIGAFHKDKLIGFILHGIDDIDGKLTCYNGGTGVIEKYRGMKITSKMYSTILPIIKEAGVKKITLEVISKNVNAIKVYEGIGFLNKRKVDSYKGSFPLKPNNDNWNVISPKTIDLNKIKQYWTFIPTWQSTCGSLERQKELLINYVVEHHNEIIGYLIINKLNGKVLQFAVKEAYRHQGIGTTLFQKAMLLKNDLMVYNVDERDMETRGFLKKNGMNYLLSQFEMELTLL